MTDAEKVSLVALAVAVGLDVREAWAVVDDLPGGLDARAASLAVAESAGAKLNVL